MITINNTTPYIAVYGRAPKLLPNIDSLESEAPNMKATPGLIRDSHRLRDVSIQSMIEGTAKARLGRA